MIGDARGLGQGGGVAWRRRCRRTGSPSTPSSRRGAFYGPKIDFDVTDALGRKWQCATIQLDCNAPERFDLTYVGEDNTRASAGRHPPRHLRHASSASSRILIEHYAGAFPIWLAPVQARAVVGLREAGGVRPRGRRRSSSRAEYASTSTCRTTSWAPRSVARSWRRFPTCSSSATRRSRPAPWRRACATARSYRPDDRGRAGRSLVRGSSASFIIGRSNVIRGEDH